MENYAGRFLTQIQTDLFIPATDRTRRANSVNHVQADPRVQKLLKEYPHVTQVSSSGYSKLLPLHGVYHHIDTGKSRASRSRARPLFGKKRATVEREFKTMLKAGVVSRSAESPWAALLQKPGTDSWRPCGDYHNLNLRTRTDSMSFLICIL